VEAGDVDWRWGTDESKRKTRDLGTLSVLKASPEVLAAKLTAIGACHLLTECRGFGGLTGPLGGALSLLCGVAYQPSTLYKCLAELAVFDAETEFYHVYGERAAALIRKWTAGETGRTWMQVVVFIDATHDPYWTDKFAESGPVSRTGRVQPCLSRLSVSGGVAGPLVMETYPGAMSLKNEVLRLLERVEAVVGDSGIGKLVVMDAEMATAELLASFKKRHFITVYKGPVKNFKPSGGEWVPFRKRDQLREGEVLIRGKEHPDGLTFRAVEMQRTGSRHPHSTIFVTNAPLEEMGTLDVAPAYLSRWPNQEQGFRERRNGLGANHSVGYGGEYVQHFALDTKLEKAQRALENAQARLQIAEKARAKAVEVARPTKAGKTGHGVSSPLEVPQTGQASPVNPQPAVTPSPEEGQAGHEPAAVQPQPVVTPSPDEVQAGHEPAAAQPQPAVTPSPDEVQAGHEPAAAQPQPVVTPSPKEVGTSHEPAAAQPQPAVTPSPDEVQAGQEPVPAQSSPKGAPSDLITQEAAKASLLRVAQREKTAAKRAVEKATEHLSRLSTTPRLIYRRDTTRENIATAATLSVLLLIEFVLREYFGGMRINLRTFIEQFIMVPVTVRTTSNRIIYQFHANPRNRKRTSQLRDACKVINGKSLRRSGKPMVFEVIGRPVLEGGGGHPPQVAEMA
jgi:hypothetical protein